MPAAHGPRTIDRLKDPAEVEAFCEAIVTEGGVKPACHKLGLRWETVRQFGIKDEAFRRTIWAARAALTEQQMDDILAIADGKGDVKRDDLRIKSRMWMAEKMMPKLYGPPAAGATVNVGVQVNQAVTEPERQRLIDLRNQVLDNTLPEHKALPVGELNSEPTGGYPPQTEEHTT